MLSTHFLYAALFLLSKFFHSVHNLNNQNCGVRQKSIFNREFVICKNDVEWGHGCRSNIGTSPFFCPMFMSHTITATMIWCHLLLSTFLFTVLYANTRRVYIDNCSLSTNELNYRILSQQYFRRRLQKCLLSRLIFAIFLIRSPTVLPFNYAWFNILPLSVNNFTANMTEYAIFECFIKIPEILHALH